MKRVIIAVLCAAALVFGAQPQPAQDNEIVEKSVPIGNLTGPNRISRLVQLLKVYDMNVGGDEVLRVITLRGKRKTVSEAEKVIAQYDVAQKNTVEIIVYLLGASEDPAKGGRVPKGLEPVTKEVARLFGYRGFGLRESAILRASEGASAGTSGFLPPSVQAVSPRTYSVKMSGAEVASDAQGRLMRVSGLEFFSTSEKGGISSVRIATESLDLREGQSVVLGKSNLHESGDVVVVVLNARVVY